MYLHLILLLCFAQFAFADVATEFPKENKQSLVLGYSGNYPIAESVTDYGPSIFHPVIGVRHSSEDWVLGVNMHFKFLDDFKGKSRLAIWTLEEEINYRILLYHPLSFLAGIKFLYLLPVQAGLYPFRRHGEHTAEIGVGVTTSLVYYFDPRTGLGFFADIWRGTGSKKFEALAMGVHLMIPI